MDKTLTVRELTEKLQSLPPDLPVYVWSDNDKEEPARWAAVETRGDEFGQPTELESGAEYVRICGS
jgi:hypothetical protein